jgi:hypothetical protein
VGLPPRQHRCCALGVDRVLRIQNSFFHAGFSQDSKDGVFLLGGSSLAAALLLSGLTG